MGNPKCSFVMGNFNKCEYLAESITSILSSSVKDIELIIVDDCSTDYSMEVINHFAKKDKRVKVFQNEVNKGIAYTYNRATEAVTSPIILVSASDDVYDHDRAKWAIRAFKKYDADIIYFPFVKAQERIVAGQGLVLLPFEKKFAPKFDAELLKKVEGQFIGHGFTAYKTDVGRKVPYRNDIKHGCDHHFFLDCWKAGFKFQNIEEEQFAGIYRFYIDMVSHKFRQEILANDTQLEKEYLGATNEKT